MNQKERTYRATFILDNRGREESIDQIVDGVKQDIAAVKGAVTAVESLGKKDFVRVTDKKLTGAAYVQISFTGPSETPALLRERLRLNNSVYRMFVQSA
ncbi:30S ribosomal protein S6 [Opitutus sp. ER46]|uniref:30S ribosomal protein S6 n=1 Tax=Opitutus sp. ER46 TaxID=2161864 RepID=UPI000D314A31|nr:30S ribosomal protein S6 [Opitutus sp. ER46]PTX96496.1 30S ribosomal protein S6 [Opitutus sp. ER46]